MFKVNDLVMYGWTGACRIVDITIETNSTGTTEYYVLQPVYEENMTIKIPVNNKNRLMRPVITLTDLASLINAMPTLETMWIEDPKQRSASYKTTLRTGNHDEVVKIIKTMYAEREARHASGRKFSLTDSNLMIAAEKQLYQEIGVVLNIPPDEVAAYIQEHVPPAESALIKN